MKNPLIKVCGITNLKSLEAAMVPDIGLIGFIFVSTSPRCIKINEAVALANIARSSGKKIVAVFCNNSLTEVIKILRLLQPNFIQLHGNENSDYCKIILTPIIKYVTLEDDLNSMKKKMDELRPLVTYFLLDRKIQGKGDILPLEDVITIATDYPVILAGGLNPGNISEIARRTRTVVKGFDVASGVEYSPGQKDRVLIKKFILNLRH